MSKKLARGFTRHHEVPCDLLASDRGPSCSNLEQIKGKKVYLVRFLQPNQARGKADGYPLSQPGSPSKRKHTLTKPHASTNTARTTTRQGQGTSAIFPHSVSIKDLLNAGKIIKPPQRRTIDLEYFDISSSRWQSRGSALIQLEEEPFAGGAFRHAFRARCLDGSSPIRGELVLKKYKEHAEQIINDTPDLSIEDHTRKQVQMHSVARNLAQRFASKVPAEFGKTFTYGKAFYAFIDDKPATVEQFAKEDFFKYINNDGKLCDMPSDEAEHKEVFQKAECFAHFTYEFSEKKLMVLDLQGSMFNLYDPEVATYQIQDISSGKAEYYFCAGNMSSVGIKNFCDLHKCNEYCAMMGFWC